MKIVEYQMRPEDISFSDDYPDRAQQFIYEHLRLYYAKLGKIPAITCRIVGGKLIITRGHKYLRIAREEDFPSVPVIIDGESSLDIQRLALGKKEIVELHSIDFTQPRFFLFCFNTKPTERAIQQFENLVRRIFGPFDSNITYPEGDVAAEFWASLPQASPEGIARIQAELLKFDVDGVQIVSQDGLKLRG